MCCQWKSTYVKGAWIGVHSSQEDKWMGNPTFFEACTCICIWLHPSESEPWKLLRLNIIKKWWVDRHLYHHINIEHLRGTEIHNELIKVHFTDRIESDDQIYCIQWNLRTTDTLGTAILSVVERLSLPWRLSWRPCPSITDSVGVANR